MHSDVPPGLGRQRHVRLAAGDAGPGRRFPGAAGRRRSWPGPSPAEPRPPARRSALTPWPSTSRCGRVGGRGHARRRFPDPGPSCGAGGRPRAGPVPRPGRGRAPAEPFCADLGRFQWDNPTIKVNWALGRPVPWTAPGAPGAGTVHLGVDLDGFVDFGRRPDGGPHPAAAVPAVRTDDHLRPHPVAGGHGVDLGVHPRPARPRLDRRRCSPTTSR